MAPVENKAIYRRVIEEVWNKGNLSVMDELFAPDVVTHDPAGPGGEMRGREAARQFITANRAAFPDLRLTIEDQIAEGDKVVTRFTARGTHRGKLLGIAPTGKQVTTTAIIINRYTGGKIAESWINGDNLGLLQQLGVIPRMAQAGA
jgi:steroid delta-isomerase-like uncharacterized protein